MFNFYASVWGRDRSNYSSDNILLGTYNTPRPPHFYHGRVGVRGHFSALFLPFYFLSFLRINLICMPESGERDRSNYSSRHILLGTPSTPRPPRFCHGVDFWGHFSHFFFLFPFLVCYVLKNCQTLGEGTGATTVAATSYLARLAHPDLLVFVTGGIGGVHRGWEHTMDISADLTELGRTDITVVCAGAKSILDIPGIVFCRFSIIQRQFKIFYDYF
jgi:hypothetical protein